ncbi:response regulator [Pseudonocardia oceani]|uniref:response regulator n=1 Tax=Pseudonocardia oceani TaxID=2792013 RepID=UPI001CF6BA63|nr:response regulator [Pseudonocardia oceani]
MSAPIVGLYDRGGRQARGRGQVPAGSFRGDAASSRGTPVGGWAVVRSRVPNAGPTRPLLVEDDVRIRQALGLALVDEGCADVEAVDPESAPATPADTRVDVVLLDLMLPGIDGWRSAGPCAPVDRHLLR